jgi:curved DNA-binding protein CbpA
MKNTIYIALTIIGCLINDTIAFCSHACLTRRAVQFKVCTKSLCRAPYKRYHFSGAREDMNWDPKSAPKLDFNEDFYSILEVDPEVNSKELKKAYYRMVFKYHPDNKEGEKAKDLCNKQMMVINAAYKVLKDPEQRAAYDRKRKFASSVGASNIPGGSSTSQASASRSYSKSSYEPPRQQQQSQSSSSSNPFGNYYQEPKKDAYAPTESLEGIFAEFVNDIRSGGGKNFMADLMEFLEDQVGTYDRTSTC